MEGLKRLCQSAFTVVASLLFAVVVAVLTHTVALVSSSPLTLDHIVSDYQHRLKRQTPIDSIASHYKVHYSPGVAVLAYTLTRFGDTLSEAELAPASRQRRHSLSDLKNIAERFGHTFVEQEATLESLPTWNDLPVIAAMRGGRYLAIHHVKNGQVVAFDPDVGGFIALSSVVFFANWTQRVLLLSFD